MPCGAIVDALWVGIVMALIGLRLNKVARWWILLIIGILLSVSWIIYRRILLLYYVEKLWNAIHIQDFVDMIRRLWFRQSERF